MSNKPLTRSAKLVIKTQQPSEFNPPHNSTTLTDHPKNPFEKSSRVPHSPPAPSSPILEQERPFSSVTIPKKRQQEESLTKNLDLLNTNSENDNSNSSKEAMIIEIQQPERNPATEDRQPNAPDPIPTQQIQRKVSTSTNPPIMANTTINEALEAAKTPSIPNFISPATFNPNRGNSLSSYDSGRGSLRTYNIKV